MKASEANLLKFLNNSPQFVIPIYQRNYSWTANQCRQLWDDLLRAGRNDNIKGHFIGSIVYVERGLSSVMLHSGLSVIDGQQRLTTGTLLVAALADHFDTQGIHELLGTFSAKKLRNYYLLNPNEEGERQYKLILSETDKDTLLAIVKGTPAPVENSKRVSENYALFQKWIIENASELEAICQGLAKLMIVDVSLDRSQDNPQLIFESMNSTGLELSQADLIRNFILMGLEPAAQTHLYKTYWRPMEKGFGQEAYAVHFDAFMRHYLIAKTGEIPNVRAVYVAFKNYAHGLKATMQDLVADIHAYATYYFAMALGAETHPALKHAFHDMRELKVDVAYPFLLYAYNDYKQQRLTADELLDIVRLVESYVFRRSVCAIPTNSLNQTFATMSRSLKAGNYVESVMAAFLLLPSHRRFPSDAEFHRELNARSVYHLRSRGYWLRRLENYERKERVMIEDYTIEHIMPQNEALSAEWQAELGANWKRIQQQWLHTLGNLTLTGYNSEYSDYPFCYKRDEATDKSGNPIGFAHSPLKLNKGLGQVATWNEDAIKERGDRLAQEAIKVWRMPKLDAGVLDAYRPQAAKSGQGYSIADFPNLDHGPMHMLFAAFRQAVLQLDPSIVENFLKLYVAYKAETNFVDVVPQTKRLLLILNMTMQDLEDPKGLCRDISNIGSWGNGDVEIGLSTLDELPYVMGLVRQSFDRQMGDAADA